MVTMFLASWMSLHLNISKFNQTTASMLWQYLAWGIGSFLFPKVLVFMASKQRVDVGALKRKLNEARERALEDPSIDECVSTTRLCL